MNPSDARMDHFILPVGLAVNKLTTEIIIIVIRALLYAGTLRNLGIAL